MNNIEFAAMAKKIATEYKTGYMLGAWGCPATEFNINRLTNQWPNNSKYAPTARSRGAGHFLFDCCGLVKGILWGWSGDANHVYGGAPYKANGVPDLDEYGLMQVCTNVSTDFSKIVIGAYVWTSGHCGIYVGDGLVAEATPKWENGVQLTALANIGAKSGYNSRRWTKWGKLPYVTYSADESVQPTVKVYIAPYELEKGHKGEQVKAIQQLLIAKGFDCGPDGADGDFGANTEKAVKKYQTANIDKCVWSDGIVGKNTWCALLGI